MQTGLVIGTATATVKHKSLDGQKLLVVQPLLADGRGADGEPVLAVDRLGAGAGETVLITSDGRTIRELLGNNTPVRWSVMGIPDGGVN
ncbi:MAG TPA: EutN/CcmL family microcompartment protein [Pirellulales bacterium]|nr:EutN/CcmL family microcompartment protein [Pirellulales bacterium]